MLWMQLAVQCWPPTDPECRETAGPQEPQRIPMHSEV